MRVFGTIVRFRDCLWLAREFVLTAVCSAVAVGVFTIVCLAWAFIVMEFLKAIGLHQ